MIKVSSRIDVYFAEKNYEPAIAQCEKYGGKWGDTPVYTGGMLDSYGGEPNRVTNSIFGRSVFFFRQGLRYVEFSGDTITLLYIDFKWGDPQVLPQGGSFNYYHAFIAPKGHEFCGPFERLIDKGARGGLLYEKLPIQRDECIAVAGFDDESRLKATYELRNDYEIIDEGAKIDWMSLRLIERSKGTIAARYKRFYECFTGVVGGTKHTRCANAKSHPKVNINCPASAKQVNIELKQFQQTLFTFEKGER